MEMPTVGERCALEGCKQLDFLPFTCSHCQRVFCKEHFTPVRHTCADAVDRVANVDDAATSLHYRCSFPLCRARSPLEMSCPACLKHFCLEHRHHGCIDIPHALLEKEREKWEAPRKLFEAAKAEADRQVSENLTRVAAKKSAAGRTAAKVQLMRLKGRAVGPKSVPTSDRVYFSVHTPLGSRRHGGCLAVYVGRQWTVGRATDEAARLCDVANKNNEPGGERLGLFRHRDGSPLASDLRLEELLGDGRLEEGESLVLEYYLATGQRLEDLVRYRD